MTGRHERLVEMEVISSSVLGLSGITVSNTAAWAKASRFYPNVTDGDINTLLVQNQVRLKDIEPNNASSVCELIQWTVTMVPNAGAGEKG